MSAPTPSGRQTKHPLPNPSGLGYLEHLPAGYATGGSSSLVVFLHGSGERGDGSAGALDLVAAHGPPKLIEAGRDVPAVVISPQLSAAEASWRPTLTISFVDYIAARYNVDPDRIYITGLSLGGAGTLMLARSRPSTPAALVAVCPPKSGTGYAALRGIPLWCFHEAGDPVVPLDHSIALLAEIAGATPAPVTPGATGTFDGQAARWRWRPGPAAPAAGEGPAFTVYAGASHDSWTAAYDTAALWDWLFAQRRGAR